MNEKRKASKKATHIHPHQILFPVAVAIYYPCEDTTWTKYLDLICKQKPETQT